MKKTGVGTHEVGSCTIPQCEYCGGHADIELPEQLISAIINREIVLFAGAGISTENLIAFPTTFYEKIHEELDLDITEMPSFPELMERFCALPNGRTRLLTRIKERLDYGHRFPEVYVASTRFHRELATLPFFDELYTTNWDDYFETVCYATPFVTADDFAFWGLPGRKVFKLHGSIHNVGSIVATSADYEKCYQRLSTGLLGSQLKIALATKTLVFIGYSLRDDDFLRIRQLVHAELKDLIPCSYWVTPDAPEKSKELDGLVPIRADGVSFLRHIKSALVERDIMIPEDRLKAVLALRDRVVAEHRRLGSHFRGVQTAEMVFSFAYQDGLVHACDWLFTQFMAGQASHKCYLISHLQEYEKLRLERLRRKQYIDVAYIEGFMNGLTYPLLSKSESRHLPLYFLFGVDDTLTSFAKYSKNARKAKQLHKTSHKWAVRAIESRLGVNGELQLHHRPFL